MINKLKNATSAHFAAFINRHPSRAMQVVLVVGQDGAEGTVHYLASILRAAGGRVGAITQNYIEIAGERVKGSAKGGLNSNPQRLQSLLAQMRRAKCRFAIIEVPAQLPVHQFIGIQPAMLVVRRCGDDYTDSATNSARIMMLGSVLERKPQFVVINKDDPAAKALSELSGQEGALSFGSDERADCKIKTVKMHPKGSMIEITIDHQTTLQLATPQSGKQAIYNAVAAAAAAYALRAPINAIEKGIEETHLQPNNCEFLPIQRPYNIVLDSASTPAGLAETLETLRHFTKNRLIVVLGPSINALPQWWPILGEIAARASDRLIVCDGEYSANQSPQTVRVQVLQGAKQASGEAKTEEIADRRAAIEKAAGIARRGDIILIASVAEGPYRQMGGDRVEWSDRKILTEIFDI